MDLSGLHGAFGATHGVFTIAMAESLGHSRRALRSWIERGHLTRVCGRAYVCTGVEVSILRRAIGARLTWPDAIVCFVTAAVLQGLPVADDGLTHVLVPSVRSPIVGIRPHYWSVHPTEVRRQGILAVTDRRTTISDCCGRLPNDEAWGLLAWLYTHDLVRAEDLEAQLGDRRHLYGVVRLRLMAAALRRSAVSIPEMLLQDFLSDSHIGGWVANRTLYRHDVPVARGDVVFDEARLVLEYDGRLAHADGRRAADALRDRRLRELGYVVVRITWERLHEQRGLLRDVIRALVAEDDVARRHALADAWNGKSLVLLRELLAHPAVPRTEHAP